MITVDIQTKVITVPQAFLSLVSGTLYSLDTNAFRLELKAWEATEEGRTQDRTHDHNSEYTVSGVTYARKIEIINGYSVEFEDGAYSVTLEGSNNNIFDVSAGILVQNSVQVIPSNSAGLITVQSGGVDPALQAMVKDVWQVLGLDSNNPLTVTPAAREAGQVSQVLAGDGITQTTVSRQ